MLFYEPSDFRENPTLFEDKDAVNSFIGQVIHKVSSISRELGILLLTAKKELKLDLDAPGAVYTDHQGNHLLYNLNYIITHNYEEENYVLVFIHEALHLLHLHPIIYKDHQNFKNHYAINLGLDTTINQEDSINQQLLESMHGISLQAMQKILEKEGFKGQLRPKQTSPYYISIIENYVKETPNTSNHRLWNQDGSDPEDQLKGLANQLKAAPITDEELNNLLSSMDSDLKDHSLGHLSDYFKELMGSGYVKKLPTFKSVMSRLMRLDRKHQRTIRAYRPEDGTNIIKKGRKQRPAEAQLIYFYGDTSGSINFQDVENTITTLSRQKQTYDAKLYLFSDEVYDFNPQNVIIGGTDIQAVFKHASEHISNKNTQIVILTDGYFERNVNTYDFKKIHFILTKGHTTRNLPKNSKYTIIDDSSIRKR